MSALGGSVGVVELQHLNRRERASRLSIQTFRLAVPLPMVRMTDTPNLVVPTTRFIVHQALGVRLAPAQISGSDNWYSKWTGKMVVPLAGSYTFGVGVDDNAAVYINGNKVAWCKAAVA